MKATLAPGLEGIYRYRVPASKTVPRIYPEAPDFQLMPEVLATGYLVALVESSLSGGSSSFARKRTGAVISSRRSRGVGKSTWNVSTRVSRPP